jgi:peptide/nickel transport system substrate-binding protein
VARSDRPFERANPSYWGPKKPKIPEVKIVGRADASVRASIVQASEAQIAYTIPPEQASQVPKTVVEKTTEVEGIRMNTEHPLLKDDRARQALILSLDTQLLMSSLYSGFSSPVNGQMIRPSALGFNTNLQPYPH